MKTSEFMGEAIKRIPDEYPSTESSRTYAEDGNWRVMVEKWGDGHPKMAAVEFHITYDPSTTRRCKKFGLWGHKDLTGDWVIGKPYRMW
jgi:hypothetical protein